VILFITQQIARYRTARYLPCNYYLIAVYSDVEKKKKEKACNIHIAREF